MRATIGRPWIVYSFILHCIEKIGKYDKIHTINKNGLDMLAAERRNRIEQIIKKQRGTCGTLQNSLRLQPKQFAVTLKNRKQGVLFGTYGGATLVDNSEIELAITERDTVNYEGKQRIGKYAADL